MMLTSKKGVSALRMKRVMGFTICQSKERVFEQARALSRYGYIVYAIQAGDSTVMDEEQIRKEWGLP
jgi:hypothetical protein